MSIDPRQIDRRIEEAIRLFSVPLHLYKKSNIAPEAPDPSEERALLVAINVFGLEASQKETLRSSLQLSGSRIQDLFSIALALKTTGTNFGNDLPSKMSVIWCDREDRPLTDKPFLDMLLRGRISEIAETLSRWLGSPILGPRAAVEHVIHKTPSM